MVIKNTIMGLPILEIKKYLENIKMRRYFVIGNPIEHSLSPELHNFWIKKNNINAIYKKIKLEDTELKDFINKLRNEEIHGINVTVPFKNKVIKYLDKL